jgi:O-antigen/teichoic acid export membrane protein
VQLAKLLGRSAVVVVTISRSPSVITLAAVTLVADVIANLATITAAMHLWPWLRLSRSRYDKLMVREFVGYGLYAFLIRVGDLVRTGMDTAIIAGVRGLATVTHYGIAMRLTEYFQDLLNQTFGVLMPVFNRYHGLNDSAAMFNGVRQASRFAVALSTSIAGGAVIFGAPFIRRWMGPPYVDAYVPLVILMLAALVGVMQTPSTSYLLAVARHRYYAVLNGFDALLNLCLSLALAPRYGMIGVALGTAIPAFITKLILQPRYVCAELGFPVSAYWREVGRVFFLSALSQSGIALIVWLVHPSTYFSIFGLAIGLYTIHALVVYLYILPADDQQVLARAIPKLNRLLAIKRPAVASATPPGPR